MLALLATRTALTHLELSGQEAHWRMPCANAAAFGRALQGLHNVQVLHLGSAMGFSSDDEDMVTDLDDASVCALAPHLAQLSQMQELCIGGRDMAAAGTDALAACLHAMSQLTGLKLSWAVEKERHSPADSAATQVPHALQPDSAALASTSRPGVGGPDTFGACALADGLPSLLRLSSLTICACNDSVAMATLVRPLSALVSLQEVEFVDVDLRGVAAVALAAATGPLSRLTKLKLRLADMRGGGVEALAPALRRLTALQHLDLGYTSMKGSDACALSLALRAMLSCSLTTLDLRGNDGIGTVGAEALATGLAHLRHQLRSVLDEDCSNRSYPAGLEEAIASSKAILPLMAVGVKADDVQRSGLTKPTK
jgi:Leucine Rich repeat